MKTIPIFEQSLVNLLSNHLIDTFSILLHHFILLSFVQLHYCAYTFGRVKSIDVRHIVPLCNVDAFFSFTFVLLCPYSIEYIFSVYYLFIAISDTVSRNVDHELVLTNKLMVQKQIFIQKKQMNRQLVRHNRQSIQCFVISVSHSHLQLSNIQCFEYLLCMQCESDSLNDWLYFLTQNRFQIKVCEMYFISQAFKTLRQSIHYP